MKHRYIFIIVIFSANEVKFRSKRQLVSYALESGITLDWNQFYFSQRPKTSESEINNSSGNQSTEQLKVLEQANENATSTTPQNSSKLLSNQRRPRSTSSFFKNTTITRRR